MFQFLKKIANLWRENYGKECRRIRNVKLWIRLGVLRETVISSRIPNRSTCMENCIILLENQNGTGVASWGLAVWLLYLQACTINITPDISIGKDGNSTAAGIVSATYVCMAKNDL